MAVTWLIPRGKDRLEPIPDKATLLRRFEGQQRVTVGSGITCAFLGDERNLREYLVAAEAVRTLKQAGHIVSFYLFDDSLDGLTARQLRVAVNKDPVRIDKYQHFCGMPIADIPSPEPGSLSWAEHFEKQLLRRLAKFDCYPTLESSAHLYEIGAYDPFLKIVLEQTADVQRLLERDFPEYNPTALFYPICPACGRIKGTKLLYHRRGECAVECENCGMTATLPMHSLRGKLNWKLDCAARWRLFNVDLEPFTKSYLEPTAGAYWIARAVSREFFGSSEIHPLLIGMVKVDADLPSESLACMPPATMRNMYVEKWNSDLHLSRERLLLAASKPEPNGEVSYLDRIKRSVPSLKVRKSELSPEEYAFLRDAEIFQQAILNAPEDDCDGVSRVLGSLADPVLSGVRMILRDAVHLRKQGSLYDQFDAALRFTTEELGENKSEVNSAIRELLNHKKGLPVRRLIYSVPMRELDLLLYAIERTLEARGNTPAVQAVVGLPTSSVTTAL